MNRNDFFEKACQMLNNQLDEIQIHLEHIKSRNDPIKYSNLINHMESIYSDIKNKCEHFYKSKDDNEFNSICPVMEVFNPSFVINYNEFCFKEGIEELNEKLERILVEIQELELMGLTGQSDNKLRILEELYDELEQNIDEFSKTHSLRDYNRALDKLEWVEKTFKINF